MLYTKKKKKNRKIKKLLFLNLIVFYWFLVSCWSFFFPYWFFEIELFSNTLMFKIIVKIKSLLFVAASLNLQLGWETVNATSYPSSVKISSC